MLYVVLVDKIVKLPWFLPATFIFVLSLFIPSIFDIDDLVINMILKGTEKTLRWDTHLGRTKRDFEVRTT